MEIFQKLMPLYNNVDFPAISCNLPPHQAQKFIKVNQVHIGSKICNINNKTFLKLLQEQNCKCAITNYQFVGKKHYDIGIMSVNGKTSLVKFPLAYTKSKINKLPAPFKYEHLSQLMKEIILKIDNQFRFNFFPISDFTLRTLKFRTKIIEYSLNFYLFYDAYQHDSWDKPYVHKTLYRCLIEDDILYFEDFLTNRRISISMADPKFDPENLPLIIDCDAMIVSFILYLKSINFIKSNTTILSD